MDIEKLIERLPWWADHCDRTNYGCRARIFLLDAATALSTLQAENKRLKNKLSELAHLPFDEPGIGALTRLMAENAELRAELEQVKQERDELERFLEELEGAVYSGQYFHLRPMIEKWRSQREG